MSLKQQIDADLKAAMLGGDKTLTTILRGLKSVILYAEVAQGNRDTGLDDDTIVQLLTKESKKRQESADLYVKGGDQDRADTELAEKEVISKYLPAQLSDEDIGKIVDDALTGFDMNDPSVMGKVIGVVKQKAGATADGARIANIVKGRIAK